MTTRAWIAFVALMIGSFAAWGLKRDLNSDILYSAAMLVLALAPDTGERSR